MTNLEYGKDEFDELLLKHLIRSEEVLNRAKELELSSVDFLSSDEAGIRLYSALAEAIFDIGKAPIERKYLELMLDKKMTLNLVPPSPNLKELFDWIYTSTLHTDIILGDIAPFIKYRRVSKLQNINKVDPVKLFEEIQKLAIDINLNSSSVGTISASPFAQLIYSCETEGMPTGFVEIDTKLRGLKREECALLVGHSSTGKTAVASFMAKYGALNGFKVLYISLEEPYENIVHRWYASQFRMRYTDLHFGRTGDNKNSVKLELERNFNELDKYTRETLLNLQVVDARALTPITTDGIKSILEQKAKEGFIPDLVFIDQLDYMIPIKKLPSGSQPWQAYQQCAFECDYLSQYKIAGTHTFGLWVIHQGKGQMKWEFGYDDIAGFKGIVKPFDISLGVGRYDKDHPFINLFSMKTRHTEHFRQSYKAEFQYMSFVKDNWSPELLKDAAKSKRENEKLAKNKVKPSPLK